MALLVLVRHGRTTANASGTLAGWTEGVGLDDTGREQAARTAARLAGTPLAAVVSSPLQRTRETAAAILEGRELEARLDDRLGECHYGEWTGRPLAELAKDPLWPVVQQQPSAVRFPGGESLREVQHRAVAAVRELDEELGEQAVWVAVSHGDVIKAVLADALGMHLDAFQRIAVDPASVSVVRYTKERPYVLRVNDSGDDLSWLGRTDPAPTSAPVGGGAGTA
ncbi:putative phosphomutase (TIGR03848 family) [Motilibacter rhizosphaerae]|uniref:Putative phosphomutase (TIGR03848 family) n=1 Tax=Motilibacter rhizosphaerae TaxID=598652 RepID=A0A4Q7NB56_9ACTN|nr:histidine phosphatase family protein [Motilibacter rhizosphaerae]RZS80050.1 putative phosphomutase (TIGR03848 family) [Motilibacter rhizosphaerae]